MMTKNEFRGTIIPTVLFVAMFALLMSTILIANVSYNFDLSLRSVETTEFRYQSFAAANELLSDLNSGLEADAFTKNSPRRVREDGRVTESWVEPLEANPKDVFVVAQTYLDSQAQPQIVRRLATYNENTLSRVYTNVPDTDKNSPDPIYYNDLSQGGSWSRLPDPPRTRRTDDGGLETLAGKVAGTIPYVTGAPDGSLYSVYSPPLDGWNDPVYPAHFIGIPIPIPLAWGDFAIKTIVAGGKKGLTVGDLAPVPQVLVSNVDNVTISKGAVFMKYSPDADDWVVLPAPEEAKPVNGQFVVDEGNYHIQGVNGAPVAFEGGVSSAMFRKGQDSIYTYSERTEKWTVTMPPGKDILLLAADQSGTPYVQTGELKPVGIEYLLNLLVMAGGFGDLDALTGGLISNLSQITGRPSGIYANTPTSKMHKMEDGHWVSMPDPPAKFFNENGLLIDSPYGGSRGPTLSGMVGGKDGELYVVNRPSNSSLVDTIYKYSDGAWEVVPPPPNKHFDSSGVEVDKSGPPSRLDVCLGSDGQLIIRVPSGGDGLDGIFVQNDSDKSQYDLLAPIQGKDGSYEQFLSQMSVGRRRQDDGLGSFTVRATYF